MLCVEVVAGRVTRDGRSLKLTNRVLELCVAIASNRYGRTEALLGEMLFPKLDECDARSAVRVYAHRLRERISPESIVCDAGVYRFCADTRVDLADLEATLRASSRDDADTPRLRERLHDAAIALYTPRPAGFSAWDWFVPIEATLAALASEAANAYARLAFRSGNPAAALELGRHITRIDPCDETGREIVIRALIALDEPNQARREYRSYADVLAREVQVAPSAYLLDLFARSSA